MSLIEESFQINFDFCFRRQHQLNQRAFLTILRLFEYFRIFSQQYQKITKHPLEYLYLREPLLNLHFDLSTSKFVPSL